MQIRPYLFFEGRCDEAIAFYRKALGAEVTMLMRFKDAPPNDAAPCNNAEKVMHAEMRIGESTLLISDGRCENKPNFHGFALTILASSGDEAQRMFTALSDGGKVTMPLSKTFFSSHFGMVDDRFGVGWMVYVSP